MDPITPRDLEIVKCYESSPFLIIFQSKRSLFRSTSANTFTYMKVGIPDLRITE